MRFPVSVGAVSYQFCFVEMEAADLEWGQWNGWQRRGVIVQSVGSGDSALELNMSAEIVRCELYIAVLDIVYDAFCKVNDALGCVRARMIDSSHGQ